MVFKGWKVVHLEAGRCCEAKKGVDVVTEQVELVEGAMEAWLVMQVRT